MTLEEAIKHAEEVAAQKDIEAEEHNPQYVGLIRECKICSAEHRQLAEWLKELLRARVLLKATHELLEKADDSPYVLNALEIIVNYDDAECDGCCLKEDIEYHFDEFGSGQ